MEDYYLVFIIDEEVLALARPTVYGVDAVTFIDGNAFLKKALETDEYYVWGTVELNDKIKEYFDM